MGADVVKFCLRYTDRSERNDWNTRKLEIANFVAGIYYEWTPVASYLNVLKLSLHDAKAVNWLDGINSSYAFSENNKKKVCEIADNEFYGKISLVWDTLTDKLNQYYPEIDWELHYYEEYGNITDNVVICDDGKLYHGSYELISYPDVDYLEEEYQDWAENGQEGDPPPQTEEEWLENYDFSVPEPTAENPFPIPRYVLYDGDYEEPGIEWFYKKIKSDVTYTSIKNSNIIYYSDLPIDLEKIKASADLGDDKASFELGLRYITGCGIKSDLLSGIDWLNKAVEQGNQDATDVLKRIDKAEFYMHAVHMEFKEKPTEPEAKKIHRNKIYRLTKLAAEHGDAEAQCGFGLYFFNSAGGNKPDYDAGMEWFKIAAENGYKKAEENIKKYQSPEGICYYAINLITYNLRNNLDNTEAYNLLRKSVEEGIPEAYNFMGIMYASPKSMIETGVFLEKDPIKAKACFEKALELKPDFTEAENNLKILSEKISAENAGSTESKTKWQTALPWKKRTAPQK